MFFRDTSNPHEVKIGIKNIGSGLAKEIKGKINPINFEMGFGSDLLPMRFGDTNTILTWDVSIPFDEGKNPLFHDGEVVLTYKDIWGKSYSTKMSVKSDVDSTRAANGHLDKNPSGTFYQIR